jgi:hypothetical protein
MTVATLLALFGMFKGEIFSQVQGWWTALTPGRLIFGGGLLWIGLLLVWRLVLRPIHRKIEEIAKRQSEYKVSFNNEQGAHVQAVSEEKARYDELEKQVKALEGSRG